MQEMFRGATSFNGAINGWDVRDVNNFFLMFHQATSFNQSLDQWQLGIANNVNMQQMFDGATAFNGSLAGWDVSKVINFSFMFRNADAVNQNLNTWTINTSAPVNMHQMFLDADSFNGNVSTWNTSTVTDMGHMFRNTDLNQNLGGWNVTNVTNMNEMFSWTLMSAANYNATLIGWAAQTVQSNVNLGAHGLSYTSAAQTARNTLTGTRNWTISGDTLVATATASSDAGTAAEAGGVNNATVGSNATGNVLTNDTGTSRVVSGVVAGTAGSATGSVGAAVTGSFGSITIAADGSYTYTVNNNNASVQALRTTANTLADVFTYTQTSSGGQTATTQITITIQGANDAPTVSQVTGAVAAYDFENGSGNAPSTVAGGPSMSVGGTVTYATSAGRIEGSSGLLFTATGTSSGAPAVSLASIPNVATTNAITVSSWVRFDQTDNWGRVFDFGVGGSSNAFMLSRSGTTNNLVVRYHDAAAILVGEITHTASITNGSWMHVAVSLNNAGNMSLYVNGSLINTVNMGSIGSLPTWTSNRIGSSNWASNALFRGAIDEFAIFDRELTAGEVSTLASATTSPTIVNKSIAENSANGTNVFDARSSDVDAGDGVIYSILSGNTNSTFAINATTGQVTVANSSHLNFEANSSYTLVVRAADTAGAIADQTVTVTVADVNEAPSDITLGSTPTGLSTAGNASLVSGTTYQLTPAANSQAGAVWGAVNLAQDLTITSRMFFGANDTGADGMAFAFQNVGPTAVGGGAVGFGVNLAGAFGISFDTFFNNHNNEINSDFSQFFRQGATANQGTSFDTANAHDNIEDGLWRDVVIVWNASTKTLSYSLDGVAIDSKIYDVVATDWGGNSNGWFGFGAGTGGATNQQQVEIISVQTGGVTSVSENATAGTVVGMASAVDPDRTGTLTYTLTNDAGGRFAINTTTGQITVANDSLLDFETETSHNVVVRATDQGGLTFDRTLTIGVTNVNEAPTAISVGGGANLLTNGSFESNLTGWTSSGTVSALTMAQRASDGTTSAAFNSATAITGGQLSQSFATEVGQTYVVSFDMGGHSFGSNISTTHNLLLEAISGGTTVLSQTATDTTSQVLNHGDGFRTFTYTFVATGTSTELRFTDNSINVGQTDMQLDRVRVWNQTLTVAENSVNGTVIGTAVGIDADGITGLTYSLTNNAGGRFTINNTTGQITVINGSLLDFETTTSHNVVIRATDAGGLTFDRTVMIGVTNVNEAPIDLVDQRPSDQGVSINLGSSNNQYFSANDGSGLLGGLNDFTIRATLSLSNVSQNWWFSYATAGSTNELLIGSQLGQVVLHFKDSVISTGIAASEVLDGQPHEWIISRNASTGTFNIFIDGRLRSTVGNIQPGQAISSGGVLLFGQEQDTLGGGFDHAQAGKGTYHDLAIYNTAWDTNRVISETGEVPAAAADRIAHWNFNALTSGQVSDAVGGRTLTLTSITPDATWIAGNAAAVGTASPIGTIAENAANGTQVLRATAVDRDPANTFIYSLTDTAGGRFVIDGSTGMVTVANSSLLNFEAATSHNITIRATDQGGLTYDEVFTVNLSDVNEAPNDIGFGTQFVGNSSTVVSGNATMPSLDDFTLEIKATPRQAITLVAESNTGIAPGTNGGMAVMPDQGDVAYGTTGAVTRSIGLAIGTNGVVVYQHSSSLFSSLLTYSGTITPDSDIAVVFVNKTPSLYINGVLVDTGIQSTATSLRPTVGAAANVGVGGGSHIARFFEGTLSDYRIWNSALDAATINNNRTAAIASGTPGLLANMLVTSINENAANGTVVGRARGYDPDAGAMFTYSLENNASGRFAINNTTGEITVLNGSLLDFETATNHTITVRATDQSGLTYDENVTIRLRNVNEGPTALTLTGVTTGAASSAVYNATLDSYYAFVSSLMTWEAAMDNAQSSLLGGVTGTLVNINSADENAFLLTLNAGANWAGGSDKLQNGIWRWYNGDTAGVQFGFNGTSVGGAYINFVAGEPNGGTSEMYLNNWSNGLWNDHSATAQMGSFVEWTGAAFRAAQGVAGSVMENATAGTVVGTLAAADVDAGETFTYTLVGGATSKFEVVGTQLRVRSGASFDFECEL